MFQTSVQKSHTPINLPGTPMLPKSLILKLGKKIPAPPQTLESGNKLFLVLEDPGVEYALDGTKPKHRALIAQYLAANPEQNLDWWVVRKLDLPKN
jgi:hypothetical protein